MEMITPVLPSSLNLHKDQMQWSSWKQSATGKVQAKKRNNCNFIKDVLNILVGLTEAYKVKALYFTSDKTSIPIVHLFPQLQTWDPAQSTKVGVLDR